MKKFENWNDRKARGFIQIPKRLFYGTKYSGLSPLAKTMYCLLKDRSTLSGLNGDQWVDSAGNVYIYFTQNELAACLGCSDDTVAKLMKELVAYNLISCTRQGYGKPNRLVVKDVI